MKIAERKLRFRRQYGKPSRRLSLDPSKHTAVTVDCVLARVEAARHRRAVAVQRLFV